MSLVDWESDDVETILPASQEMFANAPEETHRLEGAAYHAFYNAGHWFMPFRRTVVGPVTVAGDAAAVRLGASRIMYRSAALLTSDWWFNYSHFLLDALPKWRAFSDLGIDVLLVSPSAAAMQLLDLAGVDVNIHLLAPDDRVGVAQLWLASDTGPPSMKPSWVVDYLRSLLLVEHAMPAASRRLWVSRTDASYRQLDEGTGFERRVFELGFDVITASHLSVREQIDQFACADFVAGVHGAAFANMVFCPDSSALVELFDPYWLNGTFRIICAHRRIPWYFLPGEAYSESRPAWQRDVRVDGDVVWNTLSQLLRDHV